MKSQSAMEYLMTYGWAILIIAVVLSVLFQLGVFSSGNFQPHAQAGSCQVSRTAAGVSLEGQCNGLLPEFVGQFSGGSIQITSLPQAPIGNSQGTITAWFYEPSIQAYNGLVGYGTSTTSNAFTMFVDSSSGGKVCYDMWNSANQCGSSQTVTQGIWEFAAITYDGSTVTGYTFYSGSSNVVNAGSGPVNIVAVSASYPFYIGARPSTPSYIGEISNVQLYNSSLSQAEVTSLYLEGIGGAPIRPQNLMGWWPLNGNANDYSGNGNNGQLEGGVSFSSSWESGYTAP